MAKVKIQGHASGTGVLTVTAPNTSTDRTITLPDGTGTLIADNGSGKVGIGTSSPDGTAHIHTASAGSVTANTDSDDLVVENSGNGGISVLTPDASRSAIQFGHTSDNLQLQIRHDGATTLSQIISDDPVTFNVTDGSEAIRVTVDGLTFNGDTAAANALDDYEEGTWTPVFKGSGTTGSYTYSEQHGKYIKIGNQVTIWVALFNITQSSAGSGTIQIDGLPFTVSSSTHRGAVGTLELDSFTFSGSLSATVESSKTYIVLRDSRSGNTDQALQVSSRNSDTSDMCICITYIAA